MNKHSSLDSLNQIREIFVAYFSDNDLRDVCFELGIDYEILPGDNKGAKARELVVTSHRGGLIRKLVEIGSKYRPNISWPESNFSHSLELDHKESFPYEDWTAVNQLNWLENIAEWFELNYKYTPYTTMQLLLSHVFDIVRNSYSMIAPLRRVMKLGETLYEQQTQRSGEDLLHNRDLRILRLLQFGLHRQHSHLFMLPQVYKSNLLNIDEYSLLLLSTKLYARGEYAPACELIQTIARGCPLASYIMGQSYRKRGMYQFAHNQLDEGMQEIENWSKHKCPFNKDFHVMCNEHLVKAEIFRAKGVVFRKERQPEVAEGFYAQAETAIDIAIAVSESDIDRLGVSEYSPEDIVIASYERDSLFRVKADVFFSHGYYWYEQKNYEKAKHLFIEAVNALEKTGEQWDSPYTRLAVIELSQGNFPKASQLFTTAYIICSNTPTERNREAPLSGALCCLGLKVIEKSNPQSGKLSLKDPFDELEIALNKKPPLAVGPLECHRDDANHLAVQTLRFADKIITRFIHRLDQAISEIL